MAVPAPADKSRARMDWGCSAAAPFAPEALVLLPLLLLLLLLPLLPLLTPGTCTSQEKK